MDSYVAWDGKQYPGAPPDGWYLGTDQRWWPAQELLDDEHYLDDYEDEREGVEPEADELPAATNLPVELGDNLPASGPMQPTTAASAGADELAASDHQSMIAELDDAPGPSNVSWQSNPPKAPQPQTGPQPLSSPEPAASSPIRPWPETSQTSTGPSTSQRPVNRPRQDRRTAKTSTSRKSPSSSGTGRGIVTIIFLVIALARCASNASDDRSGSPIPNYTLPDITFSTLDSDFLEPSTTTRDDFYYGADFSVGVIDCQPLTVDFNNWGEPSDFEVDVLFAGSTAETTFVAPAVPADKYHVHEFEGTNSGFERSCEVVEARPVGA